MATNQFIDRTSSLDSSYVTGDLSKYPVSIDDQKQLYQATNNAETVLIQTLGYTSRYITVDDTSSFPPQGLLRIGQELIYYGDKTATQFRSLKRGFAGSRQGQWGAGTEVIHSVQSEPHNSVKDALINIETNVGTENNPSAESLNGILKSLEARFLAPKPIFQASPLSGPPPLKVTFQNFSGSQPVRYLWNFGDGGTSTEFAPIHTYLTEGKYTVKLNMITSLGAQGISIKTDYIEVNSDIGPQFFYVNPMFGNTSTVFEFVDQTVGNISSRYWVFDDGNTSQVEDPDVHTITHQYSAPGEYNPNLIVVFEDTSFVRLQLTEPIVVT